MDSQALAFLRFPVGRSRGRRYPEFPHRYRNDFQRDRDRIVHARAFRRLENKTQVFPSGISDHFRNRLTHTMEVAQIARTVAAVLGLDEDLTEALALAHDLGHPPFGHSGEMELNRQMQRFGDQFNHNLHALRIVEHFEQRYARFPGLNLTFEVREGIVKHSRELAPSDGPELSEYLPGQRPPLEAQLIDLCDEIAYNTADLDDAHAAGLLAADQLAAGVDTFGQLHDTIASQYPGATERIQFLECVRALIDLLVSSLIDGTLQAARHAQVQSVDDVRHCPQRLARFSPAGQQLNAALKAFLHRQIYSTEALRTERSRSDSAIAHLFQFFLDDPQRLPAYHREKAAEFPPHRIVCDYIAGMTDGFFWRTYENR
ncbi:MAG: deoxyguanosinetriphosphate triphosphohydrolase [Bryobacterales bacterium]|nr:deoxyguanosinetriphosphate triphosphohydrolase [Bryobacterales bacterium]